MYSDTLGELFSRYSMKCIFPEYYTFIYCRCVEYILPVFLCVLALKIGVHILKYAMD